MNRVRFVLILGALTAFGPLSVDMYLPSFPAIGRDLSADAASVQVTLSAYLVGLAMGQAVYGPLSDRLGRRGPLLFGLVLYVVASAACALAPTIESLWAARLAQSIGGCAGMVIARAAVRDLYSGAEAARFFSLLMLILGAAPIVGPFLGGQIVDRLGWRAIFWLLALLGTAALAAVALALPETLRPERRAQGGIGAALASYRVLLRDPRFLGPTLSADFVFGGLFAFLAGGPFVFIELHGVSPTGFGVLFGSMAAAMVVVSQANARLLRRFAPPQLLRAALWIYLAGAVALVVNAATGLGGAWGIALPLFVTFAMLGMAPANALALAQEHYPHAAGSATALFGTLQFGFGAIVGVVAGAVHDGTALPMAALIAASALAAVAVNRWLVPRPS